MRLPHLHPDDLTAEQRQRHAVPGQLPPRARAIAILIVAEAERSDFEWAAHAAIAAHLGVSATEIDALAHADSVEFDDHVEQIVASATRALVASGDLDDETYRVAESTLGAAGLVELSTLVGLYRALALQMRLFGVPARKGRGSPSHSVVPGRQPNRFCIREADRLERGLRALDIVCGALGCMKPVPRDEVDLVVEI